MDDRSSRDLPEIDAAELARPRRRAKSARRASEPAKVQLRSTRRLPVISAPTDVSPPSPPQVDPVAVLTKEDIEQLLDSREFIKLLRDKNIDVHRIKTALRYEEELEALQVELVRMQRWVQEKGKRIAVIFEGRDAAGKGGTIRRFTEHLNPRAMRVVALPKPTEEEVGQWYFQRYMRQLPNRGEIVFFDRSWYNRAVVEPVNGFCNNDEYDRFMRQIPEFEHMLVEDGVTLVKFWFSISKDEQLARFDSRRKNPLKQWKLSPLDQRAQELWEAYTRYKEAMFSRTHTSFSPWIIVKANNKKKARLESIRYLLSNLDYRGRDEAGTSLVPDPNVVTRFHRSAIVLD
ncbi:MAG: polyphosphate kinase 2 [Deltaproteobacteria bacterium]|nr:polyphosphate kinase 2 [Deltaproteobacteria bacterium]